MNKVIAYSLFGTSQRYTINMIINVELAKQFYPDWKVWIYYDDTVAHQYINKLKTYDNVFLIKQPKEKWKRLMWRFYAYDHPDVECVVFRDADSYLSQREKDAVEQWLSTGKSIHIMREVHPGHNSKIMAGMWGLRKTNKIKNLTQLCISYNGADAYYMDQAFLNSTLYPLFLNDMVVHDSNNVFADKTHEWPSPQINEQYIGRTQFPPSEGSGMCNRFIELERELK